jgi:site-specific recombinase XerD
MSGHEELHRPAICPVRSPGAVHRSAAAGGGCLPGPFKGASRYHTESDLRCYLTWCTEHGLDPLAARRPHLELYIRWMQEVRRFKPSTISRRLSVAAGFYRTCVIDGVPEHSPAEHVRRPSVPPESPTLGFTHLQFEALLTAARESPEPCDFALVAMLGLLGLRIFEATGADIADLGEEHGRRVLRVCGKGTKVVLIPLPPAVGRAIDQAIGGRPTARSCSTVAVPEWTATPPPAACADSPRLHVMPVIFRVISDTLDGLCGL